MSEEKKKIIKKKVIKKKEGEPVVEQVKEQAAPKPVHHHAPKPKLKKVTRFYGTGRRKNATAQVWLSIGSGSILVNKRPADEYFCRRPGLMREFNQPFALTGNANKFDVTALMSGGGVVAQADALRMGISRALLESDPGLRKVLRTNDMLKRDPREKERKKYGLKRARRAFQYSKR